MKPAYMRNKAAGVDAPNIKPPYNSNEPQPKPTREVTITAFRYLMLLFAPARRFAVF